MEEPELELELERSPKRRRLSHEDSIEVRAEDIEEASSEPLEPRVDSITVCQSPEPSSADTTLELPSSCPIEVEIPEESSICTPQPVRQAIHVALPVSSSPLSSPPLEDFIIPPSAFRPRSPPSSFPQRQTRSRVAQLTSHPPSSSPLSSPPPLCYDPYQVEALSDSSPSRRSSTSQSDLEDSFPMRLFGSSQGSSNQRAALPNMKGKDLFDASIWSDPVRTSVFYTFATSLRQKIRDCEPTTSHRFISHLRDRGKLVRCYTQNIDRIEEKVGLSTALQDGPGSKGRFSRRSTANIAQLSKMVDEVNDIKNGAAPSASQSQSEDGTRTPTDAETPTAEAPKAPKLEPSRSSGVECVFLHGSLECLRCFRCGLNTTWDDGRETETMSGHQPECPHCIGATVAREERGKRALGVGKLRPDIVLYGEEHPNAHLIGPIVTHDISLCPDLLLILGTSLRVHGLKVMVREFANAIHNRGGKVVFVNFTKPPESSWGDFIDYWVQWDCDAWVDDLQGRVPKLWEAPQAPKEKPMAKNPVAMRDSRANGAWCTKKILDELSRITGSRELPPPSEPDQPKTTKSSKKSEKRLSLEGTIQVQTPEESEDESPKDAIVVVEETQIVATPDTCVVEATIEVAEKPSVAQKATRPKRARKSAPAALERGKKKQPSSTLNPNHGRASKAIEAQESEPQSVPQAEPQSGPQPAPQDQSEQEPEPEPQPALPSMVEFEVEASVDAPSLIQVYPGRRSDSQPDAELQAQPEYPIALHQPHYVESLPPSPRIRDLHSAVGSILRSVKDNPRIRKRKKIYGDEDGGQPAPKRPQNAAQPTGLQLEASDMFGSFSVANTPGPPKKSAKIRRRRTDGSPERSLPSIQHMQSPPPLLDAQSLPPLQDMQPPRPLLDRESLPPLQDMQPPPPLLDGESLPPLQNTQPPTPPQLDPRPPPIEPLSPPQGPPQGPCHQFGRDLRRVSANLQREIDDGMRVAEMHQEAMDRMYQWPQPTQPTYWPQNAHTTATVTPAAATPTFISTPTPSAPAPFTPTPPLPVPQNPEAPGLDAVRNAKENEAAISLVHLKWINYWDTITDFLPFGK